MKRDIIINYLEQLELSPLEIKIYLLLLKLGATSAKTLIKELRVNRTSIYPPLDSLFEKGLITKIVDGSHTQFSVNDPENSLRFVLDDFVAKKKQKLQELETALPTIIKQFSLSAPQRTDVHESETKFYKGKTGVKKIYNDVIKAKEQRSYVDSEKVAEVFPDNFKLFIEAFTHNPNIKMYEIFQNTPKTVSYLQEMRKKENYFYKSLPKGVTLNAQDLMIYDNKVAIIFLTDEISALVIQNSALYDNFKALFDLVWNLLPEENI